MSSLSSFSHRAVGLVTAPVLAVAGLAALPSAAYAVEADPAPAAAGAAWLAGELTDGVLVGDYGNDVGLTIDAALALEAVGGRDADLQAIADAVATEVDADNTDYNYVSGEAFGDAGSTYAGAVAKTLVLAQITGRDTETFGGEDFQVRLEDTVSTQPADAGRIHDTSSYGDNANTIGQAFAVRALDAEDSLLTDSATDFLLAQQCSEGFFRLTLGASLAASCDAAAAPQASTDVTGLALLALRSQDDDSDVAEAIDAAAEWLSDTQAADGSWGGDAPTTAPNANSTGLASWALSQLDDPAQVAAAERGAAWLRALQADDVAPCTTAPGQRDRCDRLRRRHAGCGPRGRHRRSRPVPPRDRPVAAGTAARPGGRR